MPASFSKRVRFPKKKSSFSGLNTAAEVGMVHQGPDVYCVLLLERGPELSSTGTTLSMARTLRRFGLTQSAEGHLVVFANAYGKMELVGEVPDITSLHFAPETWVKIIPVE